MPSPLGFLPGIAYGADYNPEQWTPPVWAEDVALMRRAGVNLVSVGIFSWATLEPEPGRYEFGWLDEILDLLHANEIWVDLANATASPPPWFSHRHPETLPVTFDGRTLGVGARQAYCPSSPVFRDAAVDLTRVVAERYKSHPALAMWHVSNEIGCHNAHCYCEVSAAAFRTWLRSRYGSLDELNMAWGTAFWSQRYSDWEQITPPRLAPTFVNPTQQLDFRRFSSDAALGVYVAERDAIRAITPDIPITTNFMVMQGVRNLDYQQWASEVDIVANDHYLNAGDPDAHLELAFSADLCRGLSRGKPWMVMEHSTSAVNWQPHNVAKAPGELIRNSIQHLARGADGLLYFQWRASTAGAEKFHSAMLPHGGTDTKVWREVVELGGMLGRMADVAGTELSADVALLFDWDSWWAVELDARPSVAVTYLDQAHAYYRALWDEGITVDVVAPDADLGRYKLVIVPTLHLVSDEIAASLGTYVTAGGTAVVTYFSGVVDENDHIRPGGLGAAFEPWLGVKVEEFFPLPPGVSVDLDDGTVATTWTEQLHTTGAETIVSYASGPLTGVPAVTRKSHARGGAWYVATRLGRPATAQLMARIIDEVGVSPAAPVRNRPAGLEVTRRSGEGRSFLFLINHATQPAEVATHGHDLVADRPVDGVISVPPGGVAVVREA